tara:strand:+ start:105 stop:476 length:372 start_codon:yes stop_codon:yes gene_type:complete
MPLSGDADGSGILITGGSSGAAHTIHTAGDDGTATEKITIWANYDGASVPILHFEWGVSTATRQIEVPLRALTEEATEIPGAWTLAIPGILLKSGLIIKCYATVGSGSLGNVNLHGYAEIITG